jgi:SAM-dependent methyltransferase
MRRNFWWFIISVKLLFSFAPFIKRIFKALGFYSPGRMLDHDYAINIFNEHYSDLDSLSDDVNLGKVIVEFGPGGSNFSALIGHAMGFSKSILIDIEPLDEVVLESAEKNFYIIKDKLKSGGKYATVENSDFSDIDYTYMNKGIMSLVALESNSVDFLWSHSVLQHIHIDSFLSALSEFHRVLKPGSLMSHKIDLKDCIAFGLNNMRFSDRIWNSDRFLTSGFYTNRIRRDEMLNLFSVSGFEIIKIKDCYFEEVPLKLAQSSKDIRARYSNHDFIYSGMNCILKKK